MLSSVIVFLAAISCSTAIYPVNQYYCQRISCPSINCNNPIPSNFHQGQCCPRCPIDCSVVRCAAPTCPNPLPPRPGECCGRCIEDCRVILCLRPNCDNPITPAGRCCPICPPGTPAPPLPTIASPNRCPIEGQVFRLCASACTATCENPNPICTQECQAKCTCIGGRVVDRRVNKCVDSDQCGDCVNGTTPVQCFANPCDFTQCNNFPEAECLFDNCGECSARFFVGAREVTDECEATGTNQCPIEGQVFQQCKSCPASCTQPDLACAAVCLPGCGCPFGQLIDEQNNKCVQPNQCPGPAGNSCPIEGQVFQQCKSCPRSCTQPDLACAAVCLPGCGCPFGQLIDEQNNKCVQPNQCPAGPASNSCPIEGQTFQTCKPCVVTCKDFGQPTICPLICEPGCGCSSGTILDEDNNKCVTPDQCPPTCPRGPPQCNVPICAVNLVPPTDPCGCPTCPEPTCPRGRPVCDVPICSVDLVPPRDPCQGCPFCPEPANKCSLPRDSGPCRALIPRYFYNSNSQTCQRFFYGGCRGNTNNFETLEECQGQCGTAGSNKCSLPRDPGPCRAAITRYFFNGRTCTTFIYGGCRGNANNFETLGECRRECGPRVTGSGNKCLLPSDSGPCEAAITRYFFNGRTCATFLYGGCAGNDNNFETLQQCQRECSNSNNEDKCQLPQDKGPCRALIPRYFFNSNSQTCQRFFYGGCRGNANNFETLEECRRECQNKNNDDICLLPSDPGQCRAYFPRYFYNALSKKCEKFIYGGCRGNSNNFATAQECENRCKAKNDGNRPPICSPDYCGGNSSRICTLPSDTPGTVERQSQCDITVCHACYYSQYSLPVPRLHRRCPQVIPLSGRNSRCDNISLIRRWGYCVSKAYHRYLRYLSDETGSFRCWRPPFPYHG